MKLNKQEMTGGTKITLIISGAAMLAGIVIVVLFAAGALALSEQSRNVLAIVISAAMTSRSASTELIFSKKPFFHSA